MDRRREVRANLVAEGMLFGEGGTAAVSVREWQITILNISISSVGFFTDRPVQRGAIYRIHAEERHIKIDGRIIVTRFLARDGGFDVGAEFIE